jgi:hypothetical protein
MYQLAGKIAKASTIDQTDCFWDLIMGYKILNHQREW